MKGDGVGQDADRDFYGDFGNSILLRMCEEKPKHVDVEVVHGKLWLIGRAYAAAVERTSAGRVLMKHVAGALVESEIDSRIAGIADILRVDSTNIDRVLDVHYYLTALFKSATGHAKRSLASKYLHFHAPNAFFIFDSIAAKYLAGALRGIKRPRESGASKDWHDPTYAAFARGCLYYRDHFLQKELDPPVTPRDVDKVLYDKAAATAVRTAPRRSLCQGVAR